MIAPELWEGTLVHVFESPCGSPKLLLLDHDLTVRRSPEVEAFRKCVLQMAVTSCLATSRRHCERHTHPLLRGERPAIRCGWSVGSFPNNLERGFVD